MAIRHYITFEKKIGYSWFLSFFVCFIRFQVSECDTRWRKRKHQYLWDNSSVLILQHTAGHGILLKDWNFYALLTRTVLFVCAVLENILLFSVGTARRIELRLCIWLGTRSFHLNVVDRWNYTPPPPLPPPPTHRYCCPVAILMGDKLYLDVNMTVISD